MTFSLRRVFALTAVLIVAGGLLAISGPAAATASPVIGRWKLAPGGYEVRTGMSAVWVADVDEFHDSLVYRIDPSTRRRTVVARLPFPGGGMTVGFGSIWISDYFGDAVWRLAPSGHVLAKVHTGLQPEWARAAFGSLWVSDHHGAALTRINPSTNHVIATVAAGRPSTFRSGPQDIASDSTRLYVGSSNLQALQSVDPTTNAVTSPAPTADVFCGPMVAAGGHVWSVDGCSGGVIYRFGTHGHLQQTLHPSGGPMSVTTASSGLWFGVDRRVDPNTGAGSHAVLERRDAGTGALLDAVAIGGDAADLAAGFGDLWVYDSVANTIRRVHV